MAAMEEIPEDIQEIADSIWDHWDTHFAHEKTDEIVLIRFIARAILAERDKDRWVDINDQTPKDVPILLGWGNVHSGEWQYEADLYGSTRGGWLHGQATHWQPLPKPPLDMDGTSNANVKN